MFPLLEVHYFSWQILEVVCVLLLTDLPLNLPNTGKLVGGLNTLDSKCWLQFVGVFDVRVSTHLNGFG